MKRLATITTPLGPASEKTFLFHKMSGRETMSQLSEYKLELLSTDHHIDYDKLLGKDVTVEVDLPEDSGPGGKGKRYFNGIVTYIKLIGMRGRYARYQMTVHPALWLLTRTTDCKVFQKQTVLDIIKAVLADFPAVKLKDRTTHKYPAYDYAVQYRETDYNFIARLLEQEGITYYFTHAAGSHTLVLSDALAGHDPVTGYETVRYRPESDNAGGGQGSLAAAERESMLSWGGCGRLESAAYALTDYDFERPRVDLLQPRQDPPAHARHHDEIFDYPGLFNETSVGAGLGKQRVATRLEEQRARARLCEGKANARGLACGATYTLAGALRPAENIEYLITGTQISLLQADYEGMGSGGLAGEDGSHFEVNVTAIPAKTPFRPARLTPKPFVQGPQRAIVVGPAGDEIYTDQYGRVKVQFYWDRYGKDDQNSSCWVRVSQPWAGKNFGFVHIPRINQEVIVDFYEGDPDRPIITGRVYNAEQMPPWDLPGNATQSGLLTRSSKGGVYSNANAIRFEDKKGAEQLWLHAEKDQLTEVENDEDKWVGNDRRKTIDRDETNHVKRDRTETVDGHEKITVHKTRTEEVDLDEKITIHKNRTERVDLDEKISIGKNRSEDVGVNETIKIGANRTENVGGNQSETVAMADMQNVGLAKMLNVGLGYSINVGAAMNTVVGGFKMEQVGLYKSVLVGKNYSTTVGANRTLDVKANREVKIAENDSLEITGKHQVSVKKDQIVAVQGNREVQVKGDRTEAIKGKAKTAATGDHDLSSAATVSVDGMTVNVSGKTSIKLSVGASTIEIGPAMISINAPLVKINS
jgi:type VI secretion system secreted protein VgrG